ncbi:MAG: hypothetical protein V3U34_00450 [candidate division NC10 bacterium]
MAAPSPIGFDPKTGQVGGGWSNGNGGVFPGGSESAPPRPSTPAGVEAARPALPPGVDVPAPGDVLGGGLGTGSIYDTPGVQAAQPYEPQPATAPPPPPPSDMMTVQPTTQAPPPAPTPAQAPVDPSGGRFDLTQALPAEDMWQMSQSALDGVLNGTSTGAAAVQRLMAEIGGTPEGQAYLQQIIPTLLEAGQAQEHYSQTQSSAMSNFQDPVEEAAHQRMIAQRPEYEQMLDSGLDPYFKEQTRRSMEAMDRQAAAMGLTGSTAQAEMKQGALEGLAAEQARQESAYRMQLLQEQRGYEESIMKAAGQEGQATSRWYQDIGTYAARVEELGIMSAESAGKLAVVMDRDSFGRVVEATNAAQSQDQLLINGIQTGTLSAQAASKALLDSNEMFFRHLMEATGMAASVLMPIQQQMIQDAADIADAIASGDIARATELVNQQQGRRDYVIDTAGTVMQASSGGVG